MAAAPGARRDLTELPTFTVDPATARDFDDAVSAQREGDGVRLWIHIADVAAHVRPGSPLDLEARRRGPTAPTSPARSSRCCRSALSDDACSLAPGVERLAVTAEIELGAGAGSPRSASFYRSRIRSDARLDYDQLDEIFAGRGPPPERGRRAAGDRPRGGGGAGRAARRHQPRRRVLRARVQLRRGGQRRRRPRGRADRVPPPDRAADDPHQRAGRAAARAAQRVPAIYRVHAQPDPAAGRAPARAARDARAADAAAAPAASAPREAGAARRRGEPAGRRGGGAARARPRRRIHRSCSAR